MEKEEKLSLVHIIAASVLFAAAMLIKTEGWLRFVLFLIPYAVVGYEVVFSAIKNIFHGDFFDEEFLMTLASVGAMASGDYPEAVAVMLLYRIGELFEDVAVGKSRRSIASLMDIRPDRATVLRDGRELSVSPEDVGAGELIVVKPGEKIPLDGVITEGSSTVNVSALTGESLPQDKAEGENVVSGSVNISGLITVKVTSPFAESTVVKILELVENSSAKKAKAENFITRFSRVYTPAVVVCAVLLAVLPPLILKQPFSEWINRALVFLVVSCPCALVISVPLTFFGGIGGASRDGILIKGANYIEALSRVKTVVFDKTGTLTEGSFNVTAIHPKEVSAAELLDIAAAAESYSDHPIGESIVRAHGGHIDKTRVGKVSETSGRGITAFIDGKEIHVGNGRLMADVGADYHECHLPGTAVHISEGSKYLGHIIISDTPKADAKDAVSALKNLGVSKTVMLTGDNAKVGEAVGASLGIDEVHAGLLPDGKVAAVENLLAHKPDKTTLAFVGDGINDAPVLTRADVGIAMGALGSDAAIEAADIVLMDDKPYKVAGAIKISRKTMTIVRENIIMALGVKAVVLILGALGVANMWIAVFADVGVLMLCVLNAVRTLKIRN